MIETGRRNLPAGAPPPAIWVPRQEAHAVKNLGNAPFRLLRVELKPTAVSVR
jgi:oxalate decarboxylase/phosphoglucose isomerase-like protein (cupin superfamily)